MDTPTPVPPMEAEADQSYFFLAASSVTYKRGAGTAVHTVNSMVELPSPQIRRLELDAITQSAHRRTCEDLKIPANHVKFVTILNIQLLSICTAEEFQGTPLPNMAEPKGMQ